MDVLDVLVVEVNVYVINQGMELRNPSVEMLIVYAVLVGVLRNVPAPSREGLGVESVAGSLIRFATYMCSSI